MIKTLTNLRKQEKEKFVVPKGVQDVIPVTVIYDDGIFQIGKDKFSKTFKFSDINYAVASREDKEAMFLEYSELLNSLDSGATTKITINNRRLNRLDFEKNILIPLKGDRLDEYREEYNKILLEKATGANAIVQDKYMTISVNKKNVEDARNYFARVGADLIGHFGRLGSKCVELETDERLRIFHDFYRVGEETAYRFDMKETRKKGHSFKDYICPDTMEFEKDFFKMGNRFGRVLFLREYASYIKDSMVAELTDLNRNLMMSIDVVPVPTDEAVKEAENRLLGVETNITNWQRRQNSNNNFSATVPYYAFEVLYWCGLREGEMLALTLNDIDLEEGIITVNKTYQRVGRQDVISTPKTPSSVRKVSMPAFLCDELREYIDMLYEPEPDQRIFQITKSTLTKNFQNMTQEAGLKRITVHGLRHSHVSLLISKKYDIFEVSKRIGHKSVKTTQDIYGHLFDEVQRTIANDLDSLRRG